MTDLNNKILDIVYEAGKIVLSAPRGCPEELISQKDGTFNYVTEYDVKVQRFLEEKLSEIIPGARFFAEEEGEDKRGLDDEPTFIIDPIDGTSNFIHGFGGCAVSVALFVCGKAEFGAVYLPYTDEMFYAERGGGAYLNGEPIRVNGLKTGHALTLFGTTPYMRQTMCDAVLELARGLLMNSVDVRRCGAATVDLCNVACGRAAAFCEMLLSPWDYAAGNLIVAEAGGIVTRFDGSDVSYTEKSTIIASNKAAYNEVFDICKKISDKYGVR